MNIATNPKTGEPLKKTKKVLIYGLSGTETAYVQDNLPNADIEVMDCTGCFTDIIAHAYIAVIMNPDMLEIEDIEYEKTGERATLARSFSRMSTEF